MKRFYFSTLCACLMTMAIALSISAGNGEGGVGIVCDSGSWGRCHLINYLPDGHTQDPEKPCKWTGEEADTCIPPGLE